MRELNQLIPRVVAGVGEEGEPWLRWCCEELDALSEDGREVWEDGGWGMRKLACWEGGEEGLEDGCGLGRLEGR